MTCVKNNGSCEVRMVLISSPPNFVTTVIWLAALPSSNYLLSTLSCNLVQKIPLLQLGYFWISDVSVKYTGLRQRRLNPAIFQQLPVCFVPGMMGNLRKRRIYVNSFGKLLNEYSVAHGCDELMNQLSCVWPDDVRADNAATARCYNF